MLYCDAVTSRVNMFAAGDAFGEVGLCLACARPGIEL